MGGRGGRDSCFRETGGRDVEFAITGGEVEGDEEQSLQASSPWTVHKSRRFSVLLSFINNHIYLRPWQQSLSFWEHCRSYSTVQHSIFYAQEGFFYEFLHRGTIPRGACMGFFVVGLGIGAERGTGEVDGVMYI